MASCPNFPVKPRLGRSASFTNSTPRIGRVLAPSVTSPMVPPVRLTSKVTCTTWGVAGKIVADVQQPAHGHLGPGLLAHLRGQRGAERLTFLDLPAGQRPGPPTARVLIEQKDVIVLDDDSGDPNMHALNLPKETSR
jgi:hypothetical protein